jgi:hypothetical protein
LDNARYLTAGYFELLMKLTLGDTKNMGLSSFSLSLSLFLSLVSFFLILSLFLFSSPSSVAAVGSLSFPSIAKQLAPYLHYTIVDSLILRNISCNAESIIAFAAKPEREREDFERTTSDSAC